MRKILLQNRAIKEYYDKYYLDEHVGYLTPQRSLAEAKALIKWLGRKPRSICDVGCGEGRHLLAFQKLGVKNGFGFDLSKSLIKRAKEKLKDGPKYNVIIENFNNWQPKKNGFDITYNLFSSFGYCLTYSAAQNLINKMVAATKKGGIICIDNDNVFRLVNYLDNIGAKDQKDFYFDAGKMILFAKEKRGKSVLFSQTRYFTAPELKEMFLKAGVKEVNIKFKGGFENENYSYKSKRLIAVAKK